MGRRPCCDKANVKRGPWSSEEDEILKNHVQTYGTGGNWIALPKKAGLRRCGKSCRLRWLNYLRPDIRHGDFTEEEDNIICSLYNEIGSRWSFIASHLSGRTDNGVKNYWNTTLKKKLQAGKIKPLSNITENNENPSTNSYNATTLNFQNNMPQPNIQQVGHQIIFNQPEFQAQPNSPPQLNASTNPWLGSSINNKLGDAVSDFAGYYCPRLTFVDMETYASSSSSEFNGNNNMSTTSSSSISKSTSLDVDNNIISSLREGEMIDECVDNNIKVDLGSGEFSWDMINEFLLGEDSSAS